MTEVIGRYKQNQQFHVNALFMFDYLARSCRLLWDRKQVVHVFINYNKNYTEIHYRNIQQDPTNHNDTDSNKYRRLELRDYNEVQDFSRTIRGYSSRSAETQNEISYVRTFKDDEKDLLWKNEIVSQMIGSPDLSDRSDPLVLIMDDCDANLGCFLLFGKCSNKMQTSEPFSSDASSNMAIAAWSRTLSGFLANQVGITSETYLPSFRQRSSTPAVILYGDITNFSQLSSMLRIIEANSGSRKVEQLGEIMQTHCSEMSRIVSEHNGRIERFIGDGLMAIFGEHREHPIISIGNAMAAASLMIENLRSRRGDIQNLIYGDGGINEINEMIEVDYSIGVNYGTVLFDYLGDEGHREYSCIGDHVAFADRLMRKAARFDSDTGDKWPPIVISQTVEQHFKYWIGKDAWENKTKDAKRILHAKGYGYPSYVYAFDADLFNMEKYKRLMSSLRLNNKTEREVVNSLSETFC